MSRVICISREFGSGGHEIARSAAQKLKIPIYDKEVLDKAIETSGLDPRLLIEAEEKKTSPFRYTSIYEGNNREYYGMSASEIVFETEKKNILDAAEKGDCIIVGRCADDILKGTGHKVVSIFITAPLERRISKKMIDKNLDYKRCAALVKKVDKSRRGFYKSHAKQEWGVPHTYDVCLNSATMGTGRIISLIVEAYAKMEGEAK